ncbi:MAG: hypothetical protein ACUVQ0_04215 [Thermoproteota archaeon]
MKMIKTWLIITITSTLILIVLLAVNLLILAKEDFMIEYWREKTKATLAESCVKDIYKSVERILDRDISLFGSNLSAMISFLEKDLEGFVQRINTEDFPREAEFFLNMDYIVKYQNCTDVFIVEISVNVNIRDCENLFSIRRNYQIRRVIKLQETEIG